MAHRAKRAFELKGELSALSVLRLQDVDIGRIAHELAAKVKVAPGFFSNTPIIIDLTDLGAYEAPLDCVALKAILVEYGLIPIGVRNAQVRQQRAAAEAGLALLRNGPAGHPSPETAIAPQQQNSSDSASNPRAFRKSLMITRPVRSGQQIYARECDLVVLAQASPGSELLADGNIHIYGPLRGRALAGVHGDMEARIFCQSLEAELVAIAGNYKLIDDIEYSLQNLPVQIYLKESHLVISSL